MGVQRMGMIAFSIVPTIDLKPIPVDEIYGSELPGHPPADYVERLGTTLELAENA